MTSAISQSSAGTVTQDLVSDRSIPLKVAMIGLHVAQLLSNWVAIGYFIKTYEVWSTIELTLSLILLLLGNYVVPCIANAVIYGRRWKRSSVSNRKQIEEENKQAWVFLRISLSLIGLPTVGRYIETIIVSKKLNDLERKHIQESVISYREGSQLHPIGTSRIGSTVNQLKSANLPRTNSVISGISHASSNGVPESGQRKVRKARRQYKRCEHDGALMALISGTVGAGPLAIGLGFLYFHREEIHAMQLDQMIVVLISFSLNLLWLAATLTHFYPARHVLSEAEFERGIRPNHFWALILLFMSHIIQVTLRVLCFVVFTNWFYAYVCIPIIFHWLLGTSLLVGYKLYMKSKTVGRPLTERVKSASVSCISSLFFGYVGIFDFINGNEGKTRLRYIIYYVFYYAENVVMLVVWIIYNPTTQIRYPIPFVCSVLGLFWLGFILFQLYLYYFSYSPYGSSLIGLCSSKEYHKGNYAQEVREPVFGVPIAQSAVPLWRNNHHGVGSQMSGQSSILISHIQSSRPLPLNNGRSLSILSSQSPQHTPSIFSQPGSQINVSYDKSKANPIIKQPPVILQKEKNENAKLSMKFDYTSSDSSSLCSDDELSVFSPKVVHSVKSNPDLSLQLSDSTSLSGAPTKSSKMIEFPIEPSDVTGQFKAAPINYTNPKPTSRSLENVKPIIPVAQPNKNTKRIGTMPVGVKGAIRPLPSKDTIRALHNRRDPRSLPSLYRENIRR